jgi:hypothetical protein
MVDLLQSPGCPFASVARRQLYEAFLCIKYDNTNESAAYVRQMVASVSAEEELLRALGARAFEWLRRNVDVPGWQRHVACSQRALLTSPSLREALLRRVEDSVHRPLAMLLYSLERNSALSGYFAAPDEVKGAWLDLILDEDLLNLETLVEPSGLEFYPRPPGLPLMLPFSGLYCKRVDELRTLYESELKKTPDSQLPAARATLLSKLVAAVAHSLPGTLTQVIERYWQPPETPPYLLDFVCLQVPVVDGLSPEQARQVFLWLLEQSVSSPPMHPVALHAMYWELETAITERLQVVGACHRALSFQELLQKWSTVENTSPESLDAFLLGALSEALLPDEAVLARFGGLEAWLQASSRVLRRVSGSSAAQNPALEGWRRLLGLMHNFVSNVALPHECDATRAALRELLARARTGGVELVDEAEGLERIRDVLDGVLKRCPTRDRFQDSVDRFWALVLSSCLENERPGSVAAVAPFVCEPGRFNRYLKPVMQCLLKAAGATSQALLLDETECLESLKGLEVSLQKLRDASGDVDGPLEALLCDVMEEELFSSLTPAALQAGNGKGKGKDDPSEADTWHHGKLCALLTSAARSFRTGSKPGGILRHLCATAFLRAFLSTFTAAAVHTNGTVNLRRLDERTVNTLGRELSAPAAGTDAFLVFLVKTLRQRFPLSTARKIVEALQDETDSEFLKDALGSIPWTMRIASGNPLGFDPFRPRNEVISSFSERFSTGLELAAARKNTEDLDTCLKEGAELPFSHLGLLYGTASSLYVCRAAGDFAEPEQRAVVALKSALSKPDLPASVERGTLALAENAFLSKSKSVLFLNSDRDNAEQHLAAICAHVAVVLLPNPAVQTPLDLYAKRPADAAQHFFLASAPDLETVASNVLRRRETLTRYGRQHSVVLLLLLHSPFGLV